MAIEIERKFLVRGNAWRSVVVQSIAMDQGYLGGDRCSVRIRIEGESARLNIKSREVGARRLEFEYAIPVSDAQEMLARFAGPRVSKIRHHVVHAGVAFDIDEFLGANLGLLVAEVELEAVDAPIPRPDWLGREITDEVRFYNQRLAEAPFATWPDRDALLEELAC